MENKPQTCGIFFFTLSAPQINLPACPRLHAPNLLPVPSISHLVLICVKAPVAPTATGAAQQSPFSQGDGGGNFAAPTDNVKGRFALLNIINTHARARRSGLFARATGEIFMVIQHTGPGIAFMAARREKLFTSWLLGTDFATPGRQTGQPGDGTRCLLGSPAPPGASAALWRDEG